MDLHVRRSDRRSPQDDQPVFTPISHGHRQGDGDRGRAELGRRPGRLGIYAANDPNLEGIDDRTAGATVRRGADRLLLSAAHLQPLRNPSCVAACPAGAIYKRGEDGIVLRQTRRSAWVGACASRAVRIRRSTTTGKPASPRSAFCAIPRARNRPGAGVHAFLRRAHPLPRRPALRCGPDPRYRHAAGPRTRRRAAGDDPAIRSIRKSFTKRGKTESVTPSLNPRATHRYSNM